MEADRIGAVAHAIDMVQETVLQDHVFSLSDYLSGMPYAKRQMPCGYEIDQRLAVGAVKLLLILKLLEHGVVVEFLVARRVEEGSSGLRGLARRRRRI